MRRPVRVAVVTVALLVVGSPTVLVADSPYDPNVERERAPFAPERPTTFDRSTTIDYLVDYERTRLRNDLLASRGYTLDAHDEVRTTCTADSVTALATDGFRVRLQCRGRISDAYRLVQPTTVSYTVTYRIAPDSLSQQALDGYPFSTRDTLRARPPSAD